MSKTNAMRILDNLKLEYNILGYDIKDGKVDGVSVSDKINRPYEKVFKTLVAQSDKEYFVFIIPVKDELNLKTAAKVAGVKKIEMIPVKDITKVTGYIRGGCSPIAMKKEYKTFIDSSAEEIDMIVISAGKIGSQIEISLDNLKEAIDIEIVEL